MALDKKYLEIARKLDLDAKKDGEARDVLDSMLLQGDWSEVEKTIKGRNVIVFGCGPSLKEDVLKFKASAQASVFVTIAADGAAKALLEGGIVPDLVVTDLDGDINALIESSRLGAITIVHAHADNISRLKEVTPRLKGAVYGTTQVEPTEKMMNLGGFSDGDRAAYLAEHFKPRTIFLAGMDFGKVAGEYSGTYDPMKKTIKLSIGKRLLEELAGKTKTRVVNLTSGGENIKGTRRIGWDRPPSFKA